jgi:hypothetical protein
MVTGCGCNSRCPRLKSQGRKFQLVNQRKTAKNAGFSGFLPFDGLFCLDLSKKSLIGLRFTPLGQVSATQVFASQNVFQVRRKRDLRLGANLLHRTINGRWTQHSVSYRG